MELDIPTAVTGIIGVVTVVSASVVNIIVALQNRSKVTELSKSLKKTAKSVKLTEVSVKKTAKKNEARDAIAVSTHDLVNGHSRSMLHALALLQLEKAVRTQDPQDQLDYEASKLELDRADAGAVAASQTSAKALSA